MTSNRVAGETPNFGDKRISEWARAFSRFGLLQTWTPDILDIGLTATNKDTSGYYTRVGNSVFFFCRGTFTLAGGPVFTIRVTMPTAINDFFSSSPYCVGAFYVDNNPTVPFYDFVPAFAEPANQAIVLNPEDSLTIAWSNGDKGFSGFGFYWV